jgi:hypothetical protein
MAKRAYPREIRIGNDRYIPVIMQVVTRHPNGNPNELQCQETMDDPYHLLGMERPEFVVVFALDKSFPGFNDA